ncbi:MAG: TIGR02757 family protein [Rikenellaceae bacterium]
MTENELKELLDELHDRYNNQSFIELDPISIPHAFEKREDIEISGFLAATIAWGNRKMIVRNAKRMVDLMEGEPYRFIMEADDHDLQSVENFVHRTFNGSDFIYFLTALKNIYHNYGGIKDVFVNGYLKNNSLEEGIADFRRIFFELDHLPRVERQLSSVEKNSACKRVNMYLRWMVRNDNRGVDFGLWREIPTSALYIPLDVHAGNVGRNLELLSRKQNDWKAVLELTENLRRFDVDDPIKYDYALFGVGVNKGL